MLDLTMASERVIFAFIMYQKRYSSFIVQYLPCYHQWTHPQPRPFPAVIGRYHKRRPARARLSVFIKKVVVCGHSLVVTLSLTIDETLKWLSSLQESFWWWQCSDRYMSLCQKVLSEDHPFFCCKCFFRFKFSLNKPNFIWKSMHQRDNKDKLDSQSQF